MLQYMKEKIIYPGPRGLEWVRTLIALRKDVLAALVESTQRYGDFICFSLGKQYVYLLNHPEMVQWILQRNHRNYCKDTFQYNLLRSVTGNGLLASDGEFWLRERRLIQPAFHRKRIGAFGELMVPVIQSMLDRWERYAKNGLPINVDKEMMRLALEIIGKVMFSKDFSDQVETLIQATLSALDIIVHRARNPFSFPIWVPTEQNRRFQRSLRVLDEVVYGLIRQRQHERRMKEGRFQKPVEDEEEGTFSLLDMLLDAYDKPTETVMSERHIRDELITLLIAGHETVASAMTWTLYLLAKNPPIADYFRKQIIEGFGQDPPDPQRIESIPYVRMVFQEGLRLYPPAWILTRKALREDEVSGFRIAANSLVVISPYTLHRNPVFWRKPEQFDPNRFSEEELTHRHRFAYIPFGGGPRVCIGDSLAMLEGQLVLIAIFQRYRLNLVDENEVVVEPLVTLRPRGGVWMRVQNLR